MNLQYKPRGRFGGLGDAVEVTIVMVIFVLVYLAIAIGAAGSAISRLIRRAKK